MPRLPSELVDSIIDSLHDNPEALKRCCLVSPSWVSRTRKYLFSHVYFSRPGHLKAWKKNFPDPINSPAIHTHSLRFRRTEWVTDADVSWIRSFTEVVRLDLRSGPGPNGSLVHFYNLSPVVKSLSIGWDDLSYREVFDLICSFPLLEDLDVSGSGRINDGGGDISRSPHLPLFTGTLVLQLVAADIVRRLLQLSNGLCFRKIVWEQDVVNEFEGVRDLVERCSDTIESVETGLGPINLSKATKLKEVRLEFNTHSAAWAAAMLDTITLKHKDFKRVSICFPDLFLFEGPDRFRLTVGEETYSEWVDLDRTLIRLWESHMIHMKVICNMKERGAKVTYDDMKHLFPEMTAKKIIELELRYFMSFKSQIN